MLDDALLTVRGDRLGGHPPPGARGGDHGRPGSFSIERADGRVEALAARQADVHLVAGDRFVLRTSGGGGLGPARERDAARVRDDVATGKVTPEGAARDYGLDRVTTNGWVLGADVGGTFTDLVLTNDTGTVRTAKVPTTPVDPIDGIVRGDRRGARRRGCRRR